MERPEDLGYVHGVATFADGDSLTPGESLPRPYTLIAELTYRCPLHCPYCSNPVDYARDHTELSTDDWLRVFAQAEARGVVQIHLTGGEPLARRDLATLTHGARKLDVFTNLITSGIPLTRERLVALKEAGLDAVQLSFQGVDAATSDAIAGTRSYDEKLRVAAWVRELDLPLTVNIVLHRKNIHQIEEAIALATQLGAHRIELANTQYLAFAHANRDELIPSREDLDRGRQIAHAARIRLEGRMEVLYVMPDYYSDRPRACMDGWARRFIHVTPNGTVLPCHAAQSIPGLVFENVRDRGLGEIWDNSSAMQAFRGDAWMKEPCASCSRKAVDFGGCRCQAFLLAGDAAAADPACALSPHHGIIEDARAAAGRQTGKRFLFRGGR